jgi:hypothetical protein
VQDGRIYIERVDELFLAAGGSGDQLVSRWDRTRRCARDMAHQSGTYLKFTDTGAAPFA